jgi:hypothetical protein
LKLYFIIILYTKMLIYYIQDKDTEDTYFGSTSRTLEKRMSSHKSTSNTCVSRDIIKRDNYEYGILEDDITDKDFLLDGEKWYIQNYPCINTRIPKPTREERVKHKKESSRKYKLTHKKEIHKKKTTDDYYKKQIDCPCGGHYTQNTRNKHYRDSLIHKKYESDILITPEIPT